MCAAVSPARCSPATARRWPGRRWPPATPPRPHSHEYEQIVYIVSGRVRFVVGDDEVEAGPGDMLVVPPNVEHYAETIGDEPALDLSIFTPRREEYAAEERIG